MLILSLFLGIALATYVYIGGYILLVNLKDRMRRYFFFACMAFVVWSFGNLLTTSGMADAVPYLTSRQIGFAGSILYAPLFMRFFFILTGYETKVHSKLALNAAIWALPVVYLYKNIVDNTIVLDYPDGFWHVSIHIINNIYDLLFIVIFVIWGVQILSYCPALFLSEGA